MLSRKIERALEDRGIEYDVFGCCGDFNFAIVVENIEINIYFEEEEAEEYSLTVYRKDTEDENAEHEEVFDKRYKSIRGLKVIDKYMKRS